VEALPADEFEVVRFPVKVRRRSAGWTRAVVILLRCGGLAAGIHDSGKAPRFRSAAGRTGTLTEKPTNRVDAWRMIERRSAEPGMKVRVGCHTFRTTGITAYLAAGGMLENTQAMAAHESPRTTRLYDRTGDDIMLDEVERISI
jgi:integrase